VAVYAVAALVAAAGILTLNRGLTVSPDELSFFVRSPDLSLRDAIDPYGGQLLLTTHVLYRAIFELFGSSYLPFRLLAAGTVVTTVTLFYAFASRAVGRVAALPPSLVLLAFGPDALHALHGNSFTVLFPVGCGIAALLAVERDDRVGDVVACLLLCLAVVTFGTGLAAAAAVAIAIVLRGRRWRRLWVAAVPIAIFAAWWLWARSSSAGDSGLKLSNVLRVPAWAFDSLGTALSSAVGLNYQFPGSPEPIQAGAPLALIALGALIWRARGGPLPRLFFATLTAIVALWTMQALAANEAENFPSSPHYMYPVTVLVLLVVVEAARGVRLSGAAVVVLFGIAAFALATNTASLHDKSNTLRLDYTPQARAAFTALDVAGASADPGFSFGGLNLNRGLSAAFIGVSGTTPPTAAYLRAAHDYGKLGYPPDQLQDGTGRYNEPFEAATTDAVLVKALRLAAAPVPPGTKLRRCLRIRSTSATFPVKPGRSVILAGATGGVQVRRFASLVQQPIGTAAAGRPMLLSFPTDEVPDRPWQVSVTGPALRVCAAG
jgi:hypothetical protein